MEDYLSKTTIPPLLSVFHFHVVEYADVFENLNIVVGIYHGSLSGRCLTIYVNVRGSYSTNEQYKIRPEGILASACCLSDPDK